MSSSSLDQDILDHDLGHRADLSATSARVGKLHRVANGEAVTILLDQLTTSKLHRVHNADQLIVGKIAEHDRGIDLLNGRHSTLQWVMITEDPVEHRNHDCPREYDVRCSWEVYQW